MKAKQKWRPYVMRGRPTVTEFRSSSVDPADQRVPEVPIPSLPIEAVRSHRRETATDPRLRVVDRCFERWAITPSGDLAGVGFASIILVSSGHSGTAPLDDMESKIVDAAVRASPRWAQRFVHLWYRSGQSVAEIARDLAMKRREYVYTERDRVLCYYMGRLHEIGFSLANEA